MVTLVGLVAFDGEHVLLGRHGDLVGREAGNRQRDMIDVLTGSLDIVGWVVVVARQTQRTVDEIEKAIEAYSRPPERSRIEGSHSHILH